MKNRQTEAAWAYHDGTKHSYASIRANRHYLDWENRPLPFKIYPDLQPIPLPQHLSSSGVPALEAIAAAGCAVTNQAMPLTLQSLAELLFLSAGITRRRRHFGEEILFRAAACTGALYHIDLYVICRDLDDLPAGVYHFSPQDFALRRLRAGDHRGYLFDAAGEEPALAGAPCSIVSASTFWRNAWKYQARAYRHCYWDNGTVLANLLGAAAARQIPAKLVLGFADDDATRLLGLDRRREAPLSIVALGQGAVLPASIPGVPDIELATAPLSKSEIDYPAMRMMHEASSLESKEEVIAWRYRAATAGRGERTVSGNRLFPLQDVGADELPADSIEEVIVRRGSTREFARMPISLAELSNLLDRATGGIDGDFLAAGEPPLNELYLIVHAVNDLPAGAYVYRRRERALELLEEGNFRDRAGELGLGQEIPADCSVNIYFLADLNSALARFGNRGYRAAQLEAALMGGKIYLAAYAQRLGASGLTFFDDDVTEFFSPDAAGKSVMFLVAVGKSAKRQHAAT